MASTPQSPPPAGSPAGDLRESMFRSSPMSLVQLYIPVEAAQAVTLRAGNLGLIQFRDVGLCAAPRH